MTDIFNRMINFGFLINLLVLIVAIPLKIYWSPVRVPIGNQNDDDQNDSQLDDDSEEDPEEDTEEDKRLPNWVFSLIGLISLLSLIQYVMAHFYIYTSKLGQACAGNNLTDEEKDDY